MNHEAMAENNVKTSLVEDERPIRYAVGGWATCSGATDVSVVLNAEGDDEIVVYTSNAVGSGTPMAVWHGRHRVVGHCPTTTVPDALLAELEASEPTIRLLASLYEGSEWDGSNHRGRWADEDEPSDPEGDIRLGELPQYWEASDWFGCDPHAVVDNALTMARTGNSATLASLTADEVNAAEEGGAHLDAEDAMEALSELLRERLESLEARSNEARLIRGLLDA